MTVTPADFDFVRRVVSDESALHLAAGKEYLVESRLTPIVEREGLDSVGDLVERLRRHDRRLRDAVAEALTTNETSFFRDVHPWASLRTDIVPELLAASPGRGLRVWSAAAATGQEAYSMAMLMREHFPNETDVRILATDYSREVLETARAGRFSQLDVNRGLPAAMLLRHFTRVGRDWEISPAIRRLVRFQQLNLARRFPPMPTMDVVFLRNVLIYFDDATRVGVLKNVARVMRPGGYLFLGATETTAGLREEFEQVLIGRAVCYRATGREGVS